MKFKNEDINCCEEGKKNGDECTPIIALKIYDQRYVRECVRLGPAVSDECCECIIKYDNHCSDFGRIILPQRPICVPCDVKEVKIISDSFYVDKITVLDIAPSRVGKDYWDIEVKYNFKFKLQLFKSNMQPLKVICSEFGRKKNNKKVNDYICGSASLVKQFTLFGTDLESPTMGSDIFTPLLCNAFHTPHVLAEARAYPLEQKLVLSCESDSDSNELFDDTYDEPTLYIFITVGLDMAIKLFRFQSIYVKSCGDLLPKPYNDISKNPCGFFESITFPFDMFSPKV